MADILTPALGESVSEATVGKWSKKPGDAVSKDELLVELETDKVALEVVAPADGVLETVAAEEGATVTAGQVLGVVGAGSGKAASKAPAAEKPAERKGGGATEEGPRSPASTGDRRRQAGLSVRAAHRRGVRPGRGRRVRLRQGRPGDQGRRPGRPGGTRQPARRGRRTRRPAAHPRARGAGADDPPAPDHRPPPEGGAEHRRYADHLQRGGHERGDGPTRAVQGRLREASWGQAWLHGPSS